MRIGFPKKIPPPIDQSCVGYWKFNEASGNIKDYSGNGNTGTAYNLTYSQLGKFGTACSFNGSTSYVDLGDYDDLPALKFGATNWSVFAQIKPNNHSLESTICGLLTGSDNDFRIGIDSNNRAYITWVCYPSSPNYSYTRGSMSLNDGSWHHIGAKRNGSTITLYVDGNMAGTDTTVGTYNITGPNWFSRWSIGAHRHGCCTTWAAGFWESFFNGIINEVRIYNRTLSNQDIKRHYMAGR